MLGAVITTLIEGFGGVSTETLLAAVVSGLGGFLVLSLVISIAKELAVQQCLAVADKVGFRISAGQLIGTIDQSYAKGVFELFMDTLEDLVPQSIPEGFIDGAGGGENSNSYRKLVEYLWKS